jgi:SMI1/KNR4 family protein SUKH-1
VIVNGLKLPAAFVALIDRPQPIVWWIPKGGRKRWIYKGGEDGLYWIPTSDTDSDDGLESLLLLWSLTEVEEKTNRLPVAFHIAEYTPEEIAKMDARSAHKPGFLPFITDFSQIVRFGSMGEDEDCCFDYRENGDEPSIIRWNEAYWRREAPNFDAFISLFDDEAESGRLELDDEFYRSYAIEANRAEM